MPVESIYYAAPDNKELHFGNIRGKWYEDHMLGFMIRHKTECCDLISETETDIYYSRPYRKGQK